MASLDGFCWGEGMRLINFRDVGGLPLVTGEAFPVGQLFRSGTFEFLATTEAAELASSVGLATVIDLRTSMERKQSHPPFPQQVDVLHIPFLMEIDPEWEHPIDQSPDAIASRYLDMLERQGRKALRSIITSVVPDSLPLVIHCSTGKDRTGIVVAVLLALAGVTKEAIADDYARSGLVLQELAIDPSTADIFKPDPPDEYDTSSETMRLFLDGVRERYGSIEALALTSGIGTDDIQQARAAFLASG